MHSLKSYALKAILGESPVWCAASQTLWMVDIRGPSVLQFNPANETFSRFAMSDLTGMVALTTTGLLVGIGRSIHVFDLQTQQLGKSLVEFDKNLPNNRINDSKVGPDGALWCGTMDHSGLAAIGSLYRHSETTGTQQMCTGISIPNALCFTPDKQSVFFTDTTKGIINKAKLCESKLEFQPYAAKDIAPGYPDGSCIDEQGFVWNARYGGSCVVRIDPQGNVDRVITLPVSQPTSCALGGADMKTLFITTASQNLDKAALREQPLAGDLFMTTVDVPGLPEPIFAH